MRALSTLGLVMCSLSLLACVSARPLRRESSRVVIAPAPAGLETSVAPVVAPRSSASLPRETRPIPLYPSEATVGARLMYAPGLLDCGATDRVRVVEAAAYYHSDGVAYSITLEEVSAAGRTEILPGTPLGDCIRAALRDVDVRPFSRPRWAVRVAFEVGELGREQPSMLSLSRALRSAASAVRECHGGGEPFIVARVRFRSDGAVSRVDFPQASPNADKACIRDAIRSVQVPAFRARTLVATFPYPVAR